MKESLRTNQDLLDENSLLTRRIQELEQSKVRRKDAEEALRESEGKFRILVENANDIVYSLTLDGVFTYVSPSWTRILGHDISEVENHPFQPFLHPEDLQKCREFLEKTIKTGNNQSGVEYRVLHKDGNWRWHTTNASPLFDAGGKVVAYMAIGRDITERKQAEIDLRSSEERFRTLFNSGNDAVFVHDFDENGVPFNFIDVNNEACKRYGYSKEEFLSLSPKEMHDNETFTKTGLPAIAKLRNGENVTFESIHLTKSGKKIPVEINVVIIDLQGKKVFFSIARDITERKKAEEALRKSEERYRVMLQDLTDCVCCFRPDGRITGANEATALLVGRRPEELIGLNFLELMNEEARRNAAESIKGITVANPVVDQMQHMALPNGNEIWLEWRNRGIFDDDGQIIEIQSVGRNITERKLAEEELLKANILLEQTFEQSAVPMALVSMPDTILRIINPACRKHLWMPDDTPRIGTSLLDFKAAYTDYYPSGEIMKGTDTPLVRALSGITTINQESRSVNTEGEFRWHLLSAAPIYNNGKEIIASFVSLVDITDRKQAEMTLANEKERLAVTLRSIGDGVITTDTQGNVVIMNKVAEKLTGWPQSEAQGKPLSTVFNIINEGTRLPCENPAEKVLATGGIIELANHTLLISKDGTERIIADSGAPIMDQNSVTIGVVLVFRDMTEKQKLLDVLQRTDKLDSLGVLAGGIAHDFNNMLAGIFGYIDLARESTNDKTVAEYLDKSLGVFSRAKDLTQQLLTFSKGGTPQRKTSELGPLIRECASFALSGSKVACDYAIDKDLWLADIDKNQIGQVIDNLVINAQQAMPLGGRIVIFAKNVVIKEGDNLPLKAGMFIKLSITDTGIGISADLLKRLFDPFFTTKQKGHGLGLATCYAIVQKHEGCIDVESVMGKGSTFHVFLPASQQGTVQAVSQTPLSHQGRGRILIMDDEPSIREILGRFLKGMGYTILEAKDGEEALRLCAEGAKNNTSIAGAFFDLTIPGGIGGKEAIVQFRKLYPNVPVYASSGYSEDPVMARPTDYDFTDSIRKPYRKDELAAMLNRHTPKNASGGNTP